MSYYQALLGAIASRVGEEPPPDLADPVFEGVFATDSTSGTDQQVAGITGLPSGGALIAICATRRGNTSGTTHGVPTTTGISLASAFSLAYTPGIQQPSVSAYIQISIFLALLAETPGDGSVENVIGTSLANRALWVYSVVGAAVPLLTKGLATIATGTGLTVPFDDAGTPPADAMAIGAYAQNGVGGTGIDVSDYDPLSDLAIDFGSNMRTAGYFKRGGAANSIAFTGGETDKAKAGVGILLGQAA